MMQKALLYARFILRLFITFNALHGLAPEYISLLPSYQTGAQPGLLRQELADCSQLIL